MDVPSGATTASLPTEGPVEGAEVISVVLSAIVASIEAAVEHDPFSCPKDEHTTHGLGSQS